MMNAISDNNMVFIRDDGSPLRLAYPNEKLDALIKKHNLLRITIHDYAILMLPYYLRQELVLKKFKND